MTITGSFSKGSANPKVEFYQADQPWQFKECSSVTMLSSTKITCVTPSGSGFFWQPRVIDQNDGTVATVSNYTFANISMSYIQNGLELRKEGVSTFVDLMTPSSSAAAFQGTGYMRGIGRQVSATYSIDGTLDSGVWRVQGLNGPASGTNCYSGSPAQVPTATEFDQGRCGTFWGYGAPFYKSDGSLEDVYDDPSKLFSMDASHITSNTFDVSVSSPLKREQGGLLSFKVGSELGGFGFVPFNHGNGLNDLMPGYIDLRLHNLMEQDITGLAVRYSLQCRNMYANSTSVTLQYTHNGGDDWWFETVSGTLHQTPQSCTTQCSFTCGAQDSTCWDSNKFVDVELTNLHWQADEPFYLRWYINSDASAGTYGDPCRITDVELIPFVVESGEMSLKLKEAGALYVDINGTYAEVSANTNYTIAMDVHPEAHFFASDTTGMPRQSVVDENMTLVSSYDQTNDVEINWMINGAGQVVVRQTMPTDQTLWSSPTVIPRDMWSHIALQHYATYNGASFDHVFKVYVGGAFASESGVISSIPPLVTSTPGNSTIRIGRRASVETLDAFVGLIDEFRLWTYLRTEAEIYQDRDNTLSYTEDPNLLAYFQFNSYDSASMTTPNGKMSSPLFGNVAMGSAASPLSNIGSITLSTLTGGAVTCYEKYVVPDGRVTCNFTVFNQFGQPVPTYDHSEFQVRIVRGEGIIGPLDPDPTGISWTFTYFATNQTGVAFIQAYDKSGDPFVADPAKIYTIPTGCRSCEFRESINGWNLYSCLLDGRRFVRRQIQNVEGTCPVS